MTEQSERAGRDTSAWRIPSAAALVNALFAGSAKASNQARHVTARQFKKLHNKYQYHKAVNVPSVRQAIPHFYQCDPQKRAMFDTIWPEYLKNEGLPYDPVRIIQFMNFMDMVRTAPAGDYIELGVQRGFIARALYQMMPKEHTLYLLDTYGQRFDDRDRVKENAMYGHMCDPIFAPTSQAQVKNLVGAGWPVDNVVTVQGWFPESFAGLEDKKWRLVHIDFDLYAPIKAALEILWPNVVEGGVVIVHDYGCHGFPGSKKAVDEFAEQVGQRALPLADRWGSAAFVKPRIPSARHE